MKRIILLSVFAVAVTFLLPLLLSAPGRAAEAAEDAPASPAETPLAAVAERSLAPAADGANVLTVRTGAGDEEMTMAEYLPFALAGEMPAVFDPEALKAQAVALRSYVLYGREHRKAAHPDADVCTDAGCCAAWTDAEALREKWGGNYDVYLEKLTAAVRDTDGQYLSWEDAPALAVFHAASYGNTEDGTALGLSAPYLVSVETPENAAAVTNLYTTVEVTAAEFRMTVQGAFPGVALQEDAPETWVESVALNAAGRVAEARIGGIPVSGLALRQLFALRSTDFTLVWDEESGCFRFRVNGYGHGLGLSQYGTDLMAKSGADYAEILAHYYPGTLLTTAG